jgi:hypothetical protein
MALTVTELGRTGGSIPRTTTLIGQPARNRTLTD